MCKLLAEILWEDRHVYHLKSWVYTQSYHITFTMFMCNYIISYEQSECMQVIFSTWHVNKNILNTSSSTERRQTWFWVLIFFALSNACTSGWSYTHYARVSGPHKALSARYARVSGQLMISPSGELEIMDRYARVSGLHRALTMFSPSGEITGKMPALAGHIDMPALAGIVSLI